LFVARKFAPDLEQDRRPSRDAAAEEGVDVAAAGRHVGRGVLQRPEHRGPLRQGEPKRLQVPQAAPREREQVPLLADRHPPQLADFELPDPPIIDYSLMEDQDGLGELVERAGRLRLLAHEDHPRARVFEDRHQGLLHFHPSLRWDVVRDPFPGVQDDQRVVHVREEAMQPRHDVVANDELRRVELQSREEVHVLLRGEFRKERVLEHELIGIRAGGNVDRVPRRLKAGHQFERCGRLAGSRLPLHQEKQTLPAEQLLQFRW